MRGLAFAAYRRVLRFFWGTRISRIPVLSRPIHAIYRWAYETLKPRQPVVIEIEGNRLCVVPGYTSAMTFSLSVHGTYVYERLRTELFKQHVCQGMNVLDLGANIGYYSLLAAKLVGEDGKVFAFEPAPSNYALLMMNLAENPYTNIFPTQKAVSDRNVQLEFFVDGNEPMGSNLYGSATSKGTRVTVDTIALDDFFRGRELPIHFVKMDVEGAEMATLRGMKHILESNQNMKILVEVHNDLLIKAGSSREEFLRALVDDGFKLYAINEKQDRVETVETGDFLQTVCDLTLIDFLAVRDE